MAEGLTHRRVLTIALPIMISNITVPLLGLVDTGVVGQMGEAAPIGAVGLGAVILSAAYWLFGFLRMGTTGLTAQAVGAGRRGEVAALLTRVLLIGFAGGLCLIALQAPIFAAALGLAEGSTEVEGLAREYLGIRIWSAPAAIALFGINGWLIAQERTGAVLMLQLWMNGLNIGLDLLFVLALGWGVAGVAGATFIAEWTGLALGLWLCRAAFRVPAWRDWPRVFDRVQLIHMAAVNRDIMIRSILLTGGFAAFMFIGARFGDVTLAANQILMQFLYLTSHALDGFALAAETLVGQAMGARAVARLRRGAVLTSFWGLGICGGLTLAFAFFGPTFVAWMTTAEDVRARADIYLWWIVAAPVLSMPSFMLDGIFVGATRTRDMRNMMILSFLGYVAALMILLPRWENHGLWGAMMVFMVLRGLTLGLRYPALERAAA